MSKKFAATGVSSGVGREYGERRQGFIVLVVANVNKICLILGCLFSLCSLTMMRPIQNIRVQLYETYPVFFSYGR